MKPRRRNAVKAQDTTRSKRNGIKEALTQPPIQEKRLRELRQQVLSLLKGELAMRKAVQCQAIRVLQKRDVDSVAKTIYILLCMWAHPEVIPEKERKRVYLDSPFPASPLYGYSPRQVEADFLRNGDEWISSEIVEQALFQLEETGYVTYKAAESGTFWKPIIPRSVLVGVATIPSLTESAEGPPERKLNSKLNEDDPPVVLKGCNDSVFVLGKEKPPLTRARYDVIKKALLWGWEQGRGLTKDELDRKSEHESANHILRRLSNSDKDWRAVIFFPEKPGMGGYRLGYPEV